MGRAALTILAALVPGAIYVSVINDVTDLEEDRAAGKRNRVANSPRWLVAALLAITLGAGAAFLFAWRRDPLLFGAYAAAWIAFSLYSLPPFRFKTRGILGVLADASGAHLFPTLVAVLLAFRYAARPLDAPWLAAMGAWAFAYGLRGILWHQLTDRERDRSAAVRTFAQRHRVALVEAIGRFVAFPIELAALATILFRLRTPLTLVFLAAYAALAALRVWRWSVAPVIVAARPRYLIVLREFYGAFLPLAILIASAMRFTADATVIAVHLLLFPVGALRAALDAVMVFVYRR